MVQVQPRMIVASAPYELSGIRLYCIHNSLGKSASMMLSSSERFSLRARSYHIAHVDRRYSYSRNVTSSPACAQLSTTLLRDGTLVLLLTGTLSNPSPLLFVIYV